MSIKTALYDKHLEWLAKMVDFAGYSLPLFYNKLGIIAEHLHTRKFASIFDVSHMGQVQVSKKELNSLAKLFPIDLHTLPIGKGKYTVLTNKDGGVIDDCIVSNDKDYYFIVFNASRKDVDIKHLLNYLNFDSVIYRKDLSLLSINGPLACDIVSKYILDVKKLSFMDSFWRDFSGINCRIFRGGYTGEDGFELSIPSLQVIKIVEKLMLNTHLKPAGLAARDSLRLEAGLCLYSNELTEQTTPIEAGLSWIIPKSKRVKEVDYLGSAKIYSQISQGVDKFLVGLLPQSKIPVRKGVDLFCQDKKIGQVTSGLFSPSLKKPIAIAYIQKNKINNQIIARVRNKDIICKIVSLPFIAHNYIK